MIRITRRKLFSIVLQWSRYSNPNLHMQKHRFTCIFHHFNFGLFPPLLSFISLSWWEILEVSKPFSLSVRPINILLYFIFWIFFLWLSQLPVFSSTKVESVLCRFLTGNWTQFEGDFTLFFYLYGGEFHTT